MGWVTLIGAGISALGSYSQGQSAKDDAYLQNAYDMDAAKAQATKIRKLANQQRGEAVAALGASGVSINSTTAGLIEQDILKGGEEDAYNTILSAKYGNEARTRSAQNTANAANVQAASALAQGVSSAYGSKWKRSANSSIGGTVSSTASGVGAR